MLGARGKRKLGVDGGAFKDLAGETFEGVAGARAAKAAGSAGIVGRDAADYGLEWGDLDTGLNY